MSGVHKGVVAFVRKENEAAYFMGCPCHLIHLAAEKGANALPVSVEDQLIKVYYYLDKSSKRQKELQGFQTLHDTEIRKILKHVSTRWLSLGVCLERILAQWSPLTDYFKQEVKATPKNTSETKKQVPVTQSTKPKAKSAKKVTSQSRGLDFLFSKDGDSSVFQLSSSSAKQPTVTSIPEKSLLIKTPSQVQCSSKNAERIFENFKSRTFKLYCLFLKSVLPVFDNANKLLQSEKPCIHILHEVLNKLLLDILSRFVKPTALKGSPACVDYQYADKAFQKDNDNLFIGCDARQFIQEHPSMDTAPFYTAVRKYFSLVSKYMRENFPFRDEVLIKAAVADVKRRAEVDFGALAFFVEKFPVLRKQLGDLMILRLSSCLTK